LKLLLDENLSPRLIALIGVAYPGSMHVRDCGLLNKPDVDVWQYAKENGFAIVSKDSDFSELSVLYASPPKVVWLRIGNCTTARAAAVLRDAVPRIQAFLAARAESCLVLTPRY